MARIAAYVPDLMDRSKISAAAGNDVAFVPDPAALVGTKAELVVIDLTRPGAVDVVPRIEARVIGFANHTQRDVIELARAAGCEAMARSSFFADLPALLG